MLCPKCQNALCFLDYWHLGSLQLFSVLCLPRIIIGPHLQKDNQKKSACFCVKLARKGDATTEFSLNRLLKPYHKLPCHGMPKPKRCSSIVFKNAGTSHKSELQEDASTSLRILHAGGGCKSCHFLNDPLTLFKFSTLMLNSYIHHKPGLDNTFRWLLLKDEWSHLPWGIALSNTWKYHLH